MKTVWKWFWPITLAVLAICSCVVMVKSLRDGGFIPAEFSMVIGTSLLILVCCWATVFLGKHLPGFPWHKKVESKQK